MTLAAALVRYIADNVVRDRTALRIDESTPLIDGALIDSMGLLQIVTFLEEQTGVRIPDDAVIPDNFQTVRDMQRMVDELRTQSA